MGVEHQLVILLILKLIIGALRLQAGQLRPHLDGLPILLGLTGVGREEQNGREKQADRCCRQKDLILRRAVGLRADAPEDKNAERADQRIEQEDRRNLDRAFVRVQEAHRDQNREKGQPLAADRLEQEERRVGVIVQKAVVTVAPKATTAVSIVPPSTAKISA